MTNDLPASHLTRYTTPRGIPTRPINPLKATLEIQQGHYTIAISDNFFFFFHQQVISKKSQSLPAGENN